MEVPGVNGPAVWGGAPREVLLLMFAALPLKDRCQTVGAVCSWWRVVSLEEGGTLLLDLSLNRSPLFTQRTRNLPDFYPQRASFTSWLLRRRGSIKRLSLTAERWEDDSQAVTLRLAVAEVVAPQLESLRLVSTENGRATSAFLSGGTRLKELHLDFWGRSNGLPRAMADCTALTKLSVQCSSGLAQYKVLAKLATLQDLSIVDCDWQAIPSELLAIPLTRLHLRFADFADGRWMPEEAGQLAGTLRELALPGCQISTIPEEITQLSCLTSLSLERNYIRHLPDSLAHLRRLQHLSLEGCAGLRELPASLASSLPLRSLNLLHTAVARLPLLGPSAARQQQQLAGSGEGGGSSSSSVGGVPGEAAGSSIPSSSIPSSSRSGSGYLSQLTELRWGVAEWESSSGHPQGTSGPRWVVPAGAQADQAWESGPGGLPDFTHLGQASNLRVLQLAHVPAEAEGQLAALRGRLLRLERLQVNSAVLMG